jgi:hypothetical protein
VEAIEGDAPPTYGSPHNRGQKHLEGTEKPPRLLVRLEVALLKLFHRRGGRFRFLSRLYILGSLDYFFYIAQLKALSLLSAF